MRGHEKNSKPSRILNQDEFVESDVTVENNYFDHIPLLKQFLNDNADSDLLIFNQTDLKNEINIEYCTKFSN